MRLNARWGTLIGMTASLALVAGCSGGGPTQGTLPTSQSIAQRPVTTQSVHKATATTSISPAKNPQPFGTVRTKTWMAPGHPTTNMVFVADVGNNAIDVFDFKSKAEIGQLGNVNVPEGLATDVNSNLYESDTASQDVQIFAPPYTGTPKVLEDGGYFPVGLHVDAMGNIWVANICSGFGQNCTGGGNVIEYPAGSTTPVTLAGGPYRAYFVTTDAQGNVWADGQDSSFNAMIGYWPAGGGAFVQVPISMVFPGGIAFDKNGNLLLDDQSGASNGGSVINVYPPGSTTPSNSITVQSADDVITFALGTAEQRLFAPQYISGYTRVYSYPAGKWLSRLMPSTYTNPDAIAANPGTLP